MMVGQSKEHKIEDQWEGIASLGDDFYNILARVHYTGFWQEYSASAKNKLSKDTIQAIFYNIVKYNED